MKTKQTTRTCVQCHRKIQQSGNFDPDADSIQIVICFSPDCPNYGLLAVPEELMPKLEEKSKYGKQ